MTRGNQREIDRARAAARQAKVAQKTGNKEHGSRLTQAMSDAEKMREKQRLAELKKQGIVEDDSEQKKEYDMSYLQQFEGLDDNEGAKEEEKKEEESTPQQEDKKGKKGKKKWASS